MQQIKKGDIPVVFAYNILRNVFKQFGNQHFEHIQTFLKQENLKAELLPIVNNSSESIEQRALTIRNKLPDIISKLGVNKVHIIAWSVSGLDFRYYISKLGGDKYINSLTTIASPHRGSYLSDQYNKRQIDDSNIEPITRLIGIDRNAFRELGKNNIDDFNKIVENSKSLKYFSIGGERLPVHGSDMFKFTNNYIIQNKDRNVPADNDGVFIHNEVQWGQHLINFEADHAELVGLGQSFNYQQVYQLLSDNVKNEHNLISKSNKA